ncbi:hypothetical protein FB451DRAFT_1537166 [Mycena latifolia]|nr:hypothetical protein FB451DRAFT_1537166 [Mycena latifolia]
MSTSLYRTPISLTESHRLWSPRQGARGESRQHTDISATPRAIAESYGSRALYPRRGAVDLTAASPLDNEPRVLYPRRIIVPEIFERERTLPSRREVRAAGSEPGWDSYVVGRNEEDFPRVSFFPHDGLGAGAAMGLAFYQEGMVMKQSSIEHCLPPTLRLTEHLPFTLRWPGYTHIKVTKNITLIDPETGNHVSYGRIAQQVAQVFSAFIQRFGDDFDGSKAGIRLGPKAVTFHNLRLLQVVAVPSLIL